MEEFLNWEIFNRWAFEFITSFWGDSGFSKICGIIGVIGIWWIVPAIIFLFVFGTDSQETEKVFFNDGSEGYRQTGKVIKGDPKFAANSAVNWMIFYPFGLVYYLSMQNRLVSITGNSDFDAVIKWGIIPLILIVSLVILYYKKIKSMPEIEGLLIIGYLGLMSIPLLVWIITSIGSLIKYLAT